MAVRLPFNYRECEVDMNAGAPYVREPGPGFNTNPFLCRYTLDVPALTKEASHQTLRRLLIMSCTTGVARCGTLFGLSFS
jgi:hypothetical protein